MPQYVIERDMPGVGSLGQADFKAASQTSCSVLQDLGPEIQWVHSYVTDDKIYCIYRAPNEEMIREHAQKRRLPRKQDQPGPERHRPDDRGVAPRQRSRPLARSRPGR